MGFQKHNEAQTVVQFSGALRTGTRRATRNALNEEILYTNVTRGVMTSRKTRAIINVERE